MGEFVCSHKYDWTYQSDEVCKGTCLKCGQVIEESHDSIRKEEQKDGANWIFDTCSRCGTTTNMEGYCIYP